MRNISKKIICCLIICLLCFFIVGCKKEKNYNITYVLNGGHFTEKVTLTFTDKNIPDELPKPVKEGYNFISWMYKGNEVSDFSSILSDNNIVLEARWEKIKPYLSKDYINLGDEAILFVYDHFDDSNLNIEISSDAISIDKWLNVKAEKLGSATIKISEKNDPSNITTLNIEVINKNPIITTVSNQTTINRKIYFDINNLNELFENNINEFIWTVDNENIARVNDDHSITGLSIGEFKLIATSINDERITSYINLRIVDEDEAVVLVTENDRHIYKQGEIFELSILGEQKDNTFTWSSSNNNIVRVGESGEIIAVSTGQATINIFETGNANNRTYYELTIIENNNDIDYIGNLLTRAYSQVGYKEGPNNSQKYGEWYGNPRQPWCAMFVSWCWYYTGLSNDILLKYQGCSTGQEWCIEQGIFHYKKDYTPKPGDIIFFTSAGMGHTGICAYVEGDYMYTIEGNSSDKVGIWRWSLNDARITGYASPKYPEFNGTTKDFSFLAGKDSSGNYYWTNVSEKQDVE